MSELTRLRLIYAMAAFITVAIGLTWHLSPPLFGAAVKDIVGDSFWAAMILWLVSLVMPSRPLLLRMLAAIAICFAVETSQLYHAPFIDSIRATLPGHLVLGSGFDPRDFAAYATGVLIAALADWWWRSRQAGSMIR